MINNDLNNHTDDKNNSLCKLMSDAESDECCVVNESDLTQTIEDESVSYEEIAQMAKALAHPIRLQIIRYLADNKTCITNDLVSLLPLAQSTISEHLRILKNAQLIQGEIEGPRTSYCINGKRLAKFKYAVNKLG